MGRGVVNDSPSQKIGLTPSDAVRLMMRRIAAERALPFTPLAPNKVTLDALAEARRGGLKQYDSFDAMWADIDEED
jgi:DNA-damage-inducible protein J